MMNQLQMITHALKKSRFNELKTNRVDKNIFFGMHNKVKYSKVSAEVYVNRIFFYKSNPSSTRECKYNTHSIENCRL